MYATSADWAFDSTPDFESQQETYVARMKKVGALHWFYVLTSETPPRAA